MENLIEMSNSVFMEYNLYALVCEKKSQCLGPRFAVVGDRPLQVFWNAASEKSIFSAL